MTRISRSKKGLLATVLSSTMASAAASAADTPPPTSVTPQTGKANGPVRITEVEGITEYRLSNGLKVLLYPDASKPTVTVNVTYLVGSRHEGYGESGMAHLLEHMLFKGTPTHADIWKLLQERGAKFNGTTWYDRTNYYEELPATPENLQFALTLEADRMVNSKIDGKDLAKEFSVVRNEFEMGENNPMAKLEEKMLSAAYEWHNYGKSTIGSRSDIEKVPIQNLQAFYRRFYQPDNALLIVAGKFDEKQALALIQTHFATLPRPARVLAPTWTQEPVQDGERTVTLRRTGDVAAVAVLYHGVAGPDPDWLVEDALIDILTNKPAGRLYKALVEKSLASEVFGYVYPTAEPGVMFFGSKVRAGSSPDKARAVLLATIEALGKGKIESAALERWRTKSLKEFELALTDTASVGVALSDWAAMGDWRLFFLTRDRVHTVTTADVQRVAANFLRESNRTVGTFLPTKAPDRAPLVVTPDVPALMKGFKGQAAKQEGEVFAANVDNVEARTTRLTLLNGMRLALLPKKTKGGSVRLALTIRFGSEKDLKGKVPAAALLPPMLMRGTKKHSFQQLKDEFDRLKAEVQWDAGRTSGGSPGQAQVRVKTVRANLPAVLSLLTEVLRQPLFPRTEFTPLMKEALSKQEERLQDPMSNGFTLLSQKIAPWPRDDVRYIASVAEGVERLKSVKLADIQALHKNFWGASSAQLAIVGDFEADAIKAQVEKELGGWRTPKAYQRIPVPYREGLVAQETVNTPDKEMAFVALGHPLELRDDDPDFPALTLLNHILGGSASSRLLARLRQKEGISYGAFSGIHAGNQDRTGIFFAGAICAPQNAKKALAALLEEVARIRDKGVPAAELADAKQSYAQNWQSRIAEDDFVMDELMTGLYIDRKMDYWTKLNAAVAKLTSADLSAAAKKYLKPERFAQVTAGDVKKMK